MAHIVKTPCDEGVIQAAPQMGKLNQHVTRPSGTWVLVATILGSSMAFIDGTVVNVALPVLQTDLKATVADVQWVVEAYALFLSALILVGGSLGDHYGRRRIYATGIILFTLASAVCGFAPNITVLIAARAIQGVGGALLVPGSLAIISASFDSQQRGKAIGTWSGFTAITSALGPVLGGWLVQYASWRWVFFINVPMAIIVLIVLFWRVPESYDEEDARARLDWQGALLATLGLGGVVYGLIEANNLCFVTMTDYGSDVNSIIAYEPQEIQTTLAGVRLAEHLPHLARQTDKFSIVRGHDPKNGSHGVADHLMMSGHPFNAALP